GDVLVLPGQWAATRAADCRLRCLPGAPAPLRGRGAYLLYAGAAETSARLQPLDATEIRPGADAPVPLHLERPPAPPPPPPPPRRSAAPPPASAAPKSWKPAKPPAPPACSPGSSPSAAWSP